MKKIKTLIIPLDLYFAVGALTAEEKGILATYSSTYNCKCYFKVQDELQKHVATYYWTMNRFHLIEIKHVNFLGERDTAYLSSSLIKADLGITKAEAEQLLEIHHKAEEDINI